MFNGSTFPSITSEIVNFLVSLLRCNDKDIATLKYSYFLVLFKQLNVW
jgi:hypothetical protein